MGGEINRGSGVSWEQSGERQDDGVWGDKAKARGQWQVSTGQAEGWCPSAPKQPPLHHAKGTKLAIVDRDQEEVSPSNEKEGHSHICL